MDYSVYQGTGVASAVTFDTTIGDVNQDGVPDINVIYANGDRQALIVPSSNAAAFKSKFNVQQSAP